MIEEEKDEYAEAIFRREEMDRKRNEEKINEYDNCKHLFIPTYRVTIASDCENKRYEYCGCIKCGLNLRNAYEDRRYLSGEDELQHDYLTQTQNLIKFQSITSDFGILRDVKLTHVIYKKINKHHPDIDDEKALSYLTTALEDIENIKVNEDRKKSRIHRLGLSYSFNNWKAKDVDRTY